jgi:Asp-tRNA(Asn)/Glu-tRNA(Gln) amidotransferase A subunit family amidase
VAGGGADIGLGTDTAGSIRVPASYCGLYGMRLTHGILAEGLVNLAPSFDAVGLLTRDARTLRRACTALTDRTSEPIVRVIVIDELVALADDPVQQSFRAAVRALTGRARLELVTVEGFDTGELEGWFQAFRTTQAAEAWDQHGQWITTHPDALHPDVSARFEVGHVVTPSQRESAAKTITGARGVLTTLIPPGTALLLPATSGPAPCRNSDAAAMETVRAATLRLTCLASQSGLPALSAPLLARGPLPVGLSAIGSAHAEVSLIDLVAR